MEDHKLLVGELLEKYKIPPLARKCFISLDEIQVSKDQERGANIVFPKSDHSLLYLTLETIIDPVNILSLLCAALLLIVYEFNDEETRHLLVFLTTLLIMLVKTVLEVFEEFKINNIYKQHLDLYDCRIITGDRIVHMAKENIKVGDVLDLKRGDVVGADAVLVRSNNLTVVRSGVQSGSYTLRRTHTRRSSSFETSDNVVLGLDRVVSGRGRAVVVRIGSETTIAEMYRNILHRRKCRSDLHSEMSFMFFVALGAGLLISGILILIGISTGISFFNAVDLTVSILLALIPEGIPSTIKLLLFTSGSKLSKKGIFVRDILSIEKLGLITTILAEKSALVPSENIICSHVYDGDDLIDVELAFIDKEAYGLWFLEKIGHITDAISSSKEIQHNKAYHQPLRLLSKMCSSTFAQHNRNFKKIKDVNLKDLNGVVVDEGKFKSVYVVGGVESVLKQCNRLFVGKRRLSRSKKIKMTNLYHKMRIEGYDCMALGYRSFRKDEVRFRMKGLTFICMYFLEEVPELGLPLATSIFESAGIKFSILTNTLSEDKLKSSREIIGLDDKFVRDNEFRQIYEPAAGHILKYEDYKSISPASKHVFLTQNRFIVYRCDQEAKLNIIADLQDQSDIVCFVGSQIGDTCALAQADIGISFQDSDRISKETSSMVLNPQEFGDVIYSLEEGRLFFINLRKSIKYILMHITPQIVPFIIYVAVGTPMPLSPMLLILLNYFVEVIPAVFFSFEEPEFNLLLEPPIHNKVPMQVPSRVAEHDSPFTIQGLRRYAQDFLRIFSNGIVYNTATISWAIIEAGLICSIGCELAFYTALYRSHVPFKRMFFSANTYFVHNSPDLLLSNGELVGYKAQLNILYRGQSTYFLGLLICQFANMLVCRHEKRYFFTRFFSNIKIVVFTACGIAVCSAIVFIPFFESFMLIRRPSLISLTFPLGAALLMLMIDTMRKLRKQADTIGAV